MSARPLIFAKFGDFTHKPFYYVGRIGYPDVLQWEFGESHHEAGDLLMKVTFFG
ncbi:hypothetical protein KEJ43_05500 [Candidatus Bathyarchaeota archaeon]|nr:hypothetical protein [Candidatus Bathyarchaeota archaeon]